MDVAGGGGEGRRESVVRGPEAHFMIVGKVSEEEEDGTGTLVWESKRRLVVE